jgi:hypothetical protein
MHLEIRLSTDRNSLHDDAFILVLCREAVDECMRGEEMIGMQK